MRGRTPRFRGEVKQFGQVRLIKRAAGQAWLDPERYSDPSLCPGLATAAGYVGAALPDIMRQTLDRAARPEDWKGGGPGRKRKGRFKVGIGRSGCPGCSPGAGGWLSGKILPDT